jgi:hypothetical protein
MPIGVRRPLVCYEDHIRLARCAIDGLVRCPGCALELPVGARRDAHRYFNASPECWELFGEVLAAEYSEATLFAAAHQLSVDSYAVQHAGGAHPHKSVAIHLVGLNLVLEAGLLPTEVPVLIQALATRIEKWPELEVPSRPWALTVLDVALSDEPASTVRAWAEEVWQEWEDAHAIIGPLAASVDATQP